MRGLGAFLDGERLTPSATAELPVTLVGTSQPPFITTQPNAAEQAGRSLSAVLSHVGAVRNLGPTSLQIADVAAGRMDGFRLYGRDAGNLLGASLIAREARRGRHRCRRHPLAPAGHLVPRRAGPAPRRPARPVEERLITPATLSRQGHRSAGRRRR
ncbi:hypothetical protein [Amycolatopsis sp. NPDC051372]|uniref:inositol monophosphatase family protein n=1 Tax=unclassified Amycolatopsis TaxID=2618356 RepID=UPI003443F553